MAIRYIDRGFFKSPFVRSLPGAYKTLYCFLICECEGSGIWAVDCEVASVYVGGEITLKKLREIFIDSGKAKDLGNGRWFFPDFLEHQYPNGLGPANNAHRNFIAELLKYDLIELREVMVKDKAVENYFAKPLKSVEKSRGSEAPPEGLEGALVTVIVTVVV